MNDVAVALGDSIDSDVVIRFPDNHRLDRDNAWVTIHLGGGRPSFSLNIIKTDEGVVLDLYALDNEDQGCITTTYAFDTDVEEVVADTVL